MTYPFFGPVNRHICLVGVCMIVVLLLGACSSREQPDGLAVVPLDSLIYFSFEDDDNTLFLNLQTAYIYGTMSNVIVAEIQQVSDRELLVEVQGIELCDLCTLATGPAWRRLALPEVTNSDLLTLTISYTGIDVDSYTLSLTDDEIRVTEPEPPLFTYPERTVWKRLPHNALWIVVHNLGAPGPYPQHFYVERDEYLHQVENFRRDVELLGVKPFWPEDGYYTSPAFIPPVEDTWPHLPGNQFIEIPIQSGGIVAYNMPIVWYFLYDGAWEDLVSLISAYEDSGIGISAQSQAGDHYGIETRPQVTATPWPTPVPSVLSTPSPLATPGTSGNFGD